MKIDKAQEIADLYNKAKNLKTIRKDMAAVLQRDDARARTGYTSVTIPIRWLDSLIAIADTEVAEIEAKIEKL